tara:strand:+ start:2026 stop:2550 length:525 start_codon:yes stop_codon:yes gene_type:complete
MPQLPIIIAPDPRLKVESELVENIDHSIRSLIDNMVSTMHAAPGVGLAAPQVGVHKRIIVVDPSDGEGNPKVIQMINPEITAWSDEVIERAEGCLSLPDFYEELERPDAVEVRFVDRDGKERTLSANGLAARCIQHEVDHLDGLIFVDHLSAVKRNIILRKLVKIKKQKLRESA